MSDQSHPVLKLSDAFFAAITFGTLAKVLPVLAAGASLIWYMIRIGEWCASKLRKARSLPSTIADLNTPADMAEILDRVPEQSKIKGEEHA